jgi:hypothetical protein
MRSLAVFGALLGAALAAPTHLLQPRAPESPFTIAKPGGVKEVIVVEDNTLNSTVYNEESILVSAKDVASKRAIPAQLPLEFVNNFGGGNVNAYLSGLDSDGAIVFLKKDGSLIYPSSGGSKVPVQIKEDIAIPLPPKGEKLKLILPITITSARIYFCEGDLSFFMVLAGNGDGLVQPSLSNLADPSSGLNWGFVELTYTDKLVLYANISYVDFVGMILGMSLTVTDGSPNQLTHGLHGAAVVDICNDLITQSSSDGFPWSNLCIANEEGEPIRVLSPNEFSVINPEPFEKYWQPYVDQVWQRFTSSPLLLNTQTEAGKVECQVKEDGIMHCNGDNRGYGKPTARDIWGCDSGPFGKKVEDNGIHLAVIPRLCAAFVRSTLLLEGGSTQPDLDSSHYYGTNPTHHYSRIVHKYEVDGKGYAFAYDDVNPDGIENASGTVSSGAVDTLTIFIGEPPAGLVAPQQPSGKPSPTEEPTPSETTAPSKTPAASGLPETSDVADPVENPQIPDKPQSPKPSALPGRPETVVNPQVPDAPPKDSPSPSPSPKPSAPEPAPSTGAQSGSCYTEGVWNCVGGKQFQRCASGAWTFLQPVAPGTSCVAGVSQDLNMVQRRVFKA